VAWSYATPGQAACDLHLKDHCALERQRAKTLGGLLARVAAKITAFTTGDGLTAQCGRPLRHLAGLLV
jgi:hypothetical protein